MKKILLTLAGVIALMASLGGALTFASEYRFWADRQDVREFTTLSCDDLLGKVWKQQDYYEMRMIEAKEKKNWAESLRRKKQLRSTKTKEQDIIKACSRFKR